MPQPAMKPERWQQCKALFEQSLGLEPDSRHAFLLEACANDAPLLREVEALLASHDIATAQEFLESPAISDTRLASLLPPEPSRLGQKIGPYQIVKELGRGGMGTVYLAERADEQFHQRVAIKLVRSSFESDTLRRRFLIEREILASLEHPNIARLIDGGITGDGQSYLVMEYVEGTAITQYCDAHQLPIDERLRLFQKVCDAVHHAHQRMVVHRDLKPGNILVSHDGQVKLLDFGIAKLLDETQLQPFVEVPLTRTGLYVLTPEYAAPEQVRGEDISMATDVYSLGIILYELLSGRRPYQLHGLTPGQAEQRICELEPPRPSTVATHSAAVGTSRELSADALSECRSTRPDRLRRRLTGDLDTIVMMALRKDALRRYQSARLFAQDIQRHLDGLPVMARPDTAGYRLSRYVGRHRVGVSAVAIIFVLLLAGIVTTTWQARRAERQRQIAERRFDDLRGLSQSLLFEIHDAIVNLPGATAARALIVQRSVDYLDRLSQDAGSESSLLLELSTAYRKIGDVQGNPTNANLGETQAALRSYEKSIAMAEAALALRPVQPAARNALALTLEKRSDVQAATGQYAEAGASMEAAVAAYRLLTQEHAAETRFALQYAIGLIKQGDYAGNPNFPNRQDTVAALNAYLQAQPVLDSLHRADASPERVARLRGLIRERTGTMYEMMGKQQAAFEAFSASLALREAYAAAHPNHNDALRDLAIGYEKMADLSVKAGRLTQALGRYRQAHDAFTNLWRSDSLNASASITVAISHLHLGDLLGYPAQANLGDARGARQHYRTARSILRTVHAVDSSSVRTEFLIGLVEGRLAALGG